MGIPSNTQDPGRTNHKRQGRQKTDLGEIKHLAHILLMLDPEPSEKFPFTVCDAAHVIGSSRDGFPVLLDMLNRAKETGIEAVVMKTTRGVACSISEMFPVKKAFDDAVVAIEAMDESHQAFNDDILLTFSMVAQTDMANTENEKICGYDETENGLIINEEEAAVVRYILEYRVCG